MITWRSIAWRRGHSAHATLLWQPHWNEGGGVVAQMAEPSLSVLIWHTQAQLDTHCSPSPPTHTHPSIQSGSRHTLSCYCLRLILAASLLETVRSYKSQDGLQLCKHVCYKFVLYICANNDNIIRRNAACTWPSFSQMHHWVVFSSSSSLLSSASSVPQFTVDAEAAAAAAVNPPPTPTIYCGRDCVAL